MLGHEATNSRNRRVLSKARDLAVTLYTVVLKSLKRNSLVGTLRLLWFGVNLLLTLLSSSTKTENKVKGGLLLDIVVAQGSAVFKLLPCKNETLLIWRNTFFVLDLGLDIVNGVASLNIERNSFTYCSDVS